MTGYILAATPRSGSTLLCALLNSSGVAGDPRSLFRAEDRADFAAAWGTRDWPSYLAAAEVAARGGTPIAGLRLMWPTCAELLSLGVDVARLYGETRFISLTRGDAEGQAVSRLKAEMSGIWHIGIEEAATPGRPTYDFARLKAFADEVRHETAAWETFFAAQSITPLRVTYETLAQDPVGTAEAVLRYLGLSAWQPLRARNARMADAESAVWVRRFRAELAQRGEV